MAPGIIPVVVVVPVAMMVEVDVVVVVIVVVVIVLISRPSVESVTRAVVALRTLLVVLLWLVVVDVMVCADSAAPIKTKQTESRVHV